MTSEIRSGGDGNREATASLPALPQNLLNPVTGEILPATAENATHVLAALRDLAARVNDAKALCRELIAEESRRQGTKTLRFGGMVAEVKGGSEVVWDISGLLEGLREKGCPEDRLEALVTATIEYKVNQQVARQLAAANPDYEAAIEAAKERVPAPIYVSVKGER